MKLQSLKLVTIVAESVLREPLIHKIVELGATGVSYHSTGGTGSRGTRHDVVLGENVQIKVVCNAEVATTILQYIHQHYFERDACIAWLIDVQVMAGDVFSKKK